MICKRSIEKPVGNTTVPIKPLIGSLLKFIEKYLPLFPDELIRVGINPEQETEKILNQNLVDYFNIFSYDYNPYLDIKFNFRKDDERNGSNFKPDVGVTVFNPKEKKLYPQSFFVFECKRLPVPNISNTRSEKEYVIGINKNTGGIERFKFKKHGNHLEESSLIGYVQSGKLIDWHSQINEWIKHEIKNDNSNWTENDYLTNVSNSINLNRYKSLCKRRNLVDITIHHYLIKMHKKTD